MMEVLAYWGLIGFAGGTVLALYCDDLALRHHPAVVEGEVVVECAATVREAERVLRRAR
jgi:hypothetical protein